MNKIIILLLMLFTFYSPSLFSQEDWQPCLPNCQEVDWTPSSDQDALITSINFCGKQLQIAYRHRFACGKYEYYLEAIDGDLDCLSQYNNNMQAFVNAVCEQLIIKNPSNFPPPDSGGCATNIRIVKGNCWIWDTVVGLGGPSDPGALGTVGYPHTRMYFDPIIWPCSSNNCCIQQYTVCINQGQRIITQTSYLPPPQGCGEEFQGYWKCSHVCGTWQDESLPPPGD